MKLYISIILILIFAFGVYAQPSKCTMKASQFPAIRGLKLGMTKAQVLKLYPALSLKKPRVSIMNDALEGIIYNKQIPPSFAKDIDYIYITFHDISLSDISFYYDDLLTWDSPKEFAQQVAQSVNLPFDKWIKASVDEHSYFASCADFNLNATVSETGRAELSVYQNFDKTFKEDSKRKKEFKP